MPTTDLPSELQIEPVGQCNLRCQMCAIQFRRDGPPNGPPAFLAYDLFTKIVDQLPGLRRLQLQGLGEPMMHPRFFDMVAYAAARGVRVSTNTNLTLINDKRAELCVTSGLAELHASIDGATAETYERIRVRARFERVEANLRRLVETRRRLDSPSPWLRLVVVVMRQNLHELPELVWLAHRWGVDGVHVQHLCHDFGESTLPAHYRPMRAFVDEQTLLHEDLERVERYFGGARRVAEELGVKLRLPRARPRPHTPGMPGPKRCDWPWRAMYMSYDGRAMPCCMVSTPDRINFGSVVDRPLGEVWRSPDYEAFREQLGSDDPPELCRSCAVYHGIF
jgi:radical SAM protein with 4Fe4S-binding SPASM domain